jgi:Ca-activated chloride channel family protein
MSAITIMNEEEIERTEETASEAGFGCLQTSEGNLPVKGLDVSATITGLVAEITVRQTYVNRFEQPLEATYVFPLPDRAAVSDFKMIVGGRVIDGVLKERGEARREYQQAIEQGHRASIVEEERPDTFTMRVGNIEPGEEATIEFKLTGPLVFADGEATFRFPLVVAPRYIPGKPLDGGNVGDGTAHDTDAVPDASRITPPTLLPGFPNPIDLRIAVELMEGDLPVSNVRSSLHAVTVDEKDGRRHIEIQPGERVNRDFILRFDVADEDVRTGLTYARDPEGDQGTFMVTLVPPSEGQGEEQPRDIVFVLDRSGSMGGWKMVAARRALGRMLDTLTPHDRFQVMVFDNQCEKFENDLTEATNRNRYQAIEKLSRVEARGGTEMASPIFEALDTLSGGYADRRRMVVLVTDGQVGNEDQILRGVQQRLKNVRMFTVGIDQAVNAGFLNRLADIGGGRCELVESESRLDEAMNRIHRTIDTPVLTELAVSIDGVDYVSGTLNPEREPDLFAGAPVTISGRFEGAGAPIVKLKAAHRDGSRWEQSIRGRETGDDAISRIWARARVRAMEDRYATGRDPELSKEITEVSLRFGVLCRFTSWVAVDRSETIESDGELREVVQPVEAPQGWDMMAKEARRRAAPAPAAPMKKMRAQAAPPPSASASQAGGGPGGSAGFGAMDDMAMESRVLSESAKGEAPMEMEEMAAPPSPPPRQDEGLAQTRAGVVKGDFAYMSPEEVRGETADLSSDVFVLGAIAFELLVGRPLFRERASQMETLQAIVGWDRSELGRESAIHGDWFDVLHRALAPDPSDRHASARELLDDLEARFGRDALFGEADWNATWSGTRQLSSLGGVVTEGSALVVFAWLVSHVAHEQERTGRPVGGIRPGEVLVDEKGRAHLRSHNGPGFFDRLKRWLGLEKGPESKPRADREDFWK